MNMRRIELQSGALALNRKSPRQARRKLRAANADAGKADAAEVVDSLDIGRQQIGCRQRDIDEFRTDADHDPGAGRKRVVAPSQPNRMTVARLVVDAGG